jgi:hypothetical protein
MDSQFTTAESYKRFVSWQCRLRKLSMRERGGQPTPGMSAGVFSVSGGEQQTSINFLIVKQDSEFLNTEFKHIIRKTHDAAERVKNGLRILSERHYQDDFDFSNELTALFGLDSELADALIAARQCKLRFAEGSIEYDFKFSVREMPEQGPNFQATYWHNHLFNPSIPGKVRVLGFTPSL